MAMSRCVSLALFAGIYTVDGMRSRGRKSSVQVLTQEGVKFVAGTPMFNKDNVRANRDGKADYTLMTYEEMTDTELMSVCQEAGKACTAVGHPSDGGLGYLKFHGTETELESTLQAVPNVIMQIEPDLPMGIPEGEEDADPEPGLLLWGLKRVGVQTRPNSGAGVHIYVLDTGVRVTHNDFGGRAVPSLDMTTGVAVECNGDQKCAKDGQGHGTHCAGTAAGKDYGVASGATIHAVKVLADNGRGEFSWAIGALDFIMAKGNRPAVASMSLGGEGIVTSIETTINAATAKGIVVSVAGGNSNKDACNFSPAFVPTAITVGSTNALDVRSIFSNYGSCTNIWAPGSQIVSAGFLTDWTAVPKDGTSMACPHVSGAAAIVLSAERNLSPKQVLQKLLTNALDDKIWNLKKDDTNKFLWVGA